MRNRQRGGRELVGALGAVAAGLGGAQSSEAAPVFTLVDVDIPADIGDYRVDLNADGISEFDIQVFDTVTKVADFTIGGDDPMPTSMAAVVEDPSDLRTANLSLGTLIGPDSMWGPEGDTPTGGDPLNGTIDHDDDEFTPNEPAGHFQVSDGPGFIGVKFQIEGSTHYGYVGYEGTGAENDASGHIYALGYEDVADTAIEAGAGMPMGVPGDYNGNGTVDAADYTVWRDSLGGTSLPNEGAGISPGTVDDDDYNFWKQRFGAMSGGGSGLGGGAAVPEPTSLCLLAAGAAGVSLYRRRQSK